MVNRKHRYFSGKIAFFLKKSHEEIPLRASPAARAS
jgi:hypothetical protein